MGAMAMVREGDVAQETAVRALMASAMAEVVELETKLVEACTLVKNTLQNHCKALPLHVFVSLP